jgi:hypothetical protein
MTGMMKKEENGYWELLNATNLSEGDTLGRSNPKYVDWDSCYELVCCTEEACCLSKGRYHETGKEVMEWHPLLHCLLGSVG